MENAWNEYLKLESDVQHLKQTLQEQHRRAFFFQVTQGLFTPAELSFLESLHLWGCAPSPGAFSSPSEAQSACHAKLSLGDPLPQPGCDEKPHPAHPASLLSTMSPGA